MPSVVTVDDVVSHLNGRIVDDPAVFEIFGALNSRHFKMALVQPTFIEASHNGHFAYYIPRPIGAIGFDPRTLEQVPAQIADSMLHEMIHMDLDENHGDADQNHGRAFTMAANRIGRMLGLRPVQPFSDAAVEWPRSRRKRDLWR